MDLDDNNLFVAKWTNIGSRPTTRTMEPLMQLPTKNPLCGPSSTSACSGSFLSWTSEDVNSFGLDQLVSMISFRVHCPHLAPSLLLKYRVWKQTRLWCTRNVIYTALFLQSLYCYFNCLDYALTTWKRFQKPYLLIQESIDSSKN